MPKDNTQELFYLVDENDRVLGPITRKKAHQDSSKIHRSIAIVILNERGEILLQKRSLLKDMDPGVWSISVGGHVTFGDDYETTAKRELKEELGVTLPLEAKLTYMAAKSDETEMVRVFVAKAPKYLTFKLDLDEVDQVEWVGTEALTDFTNDRPFAQWSRLCLQKLGYIS